MSKLELESKVFSHLDMLNTQNQLNIGGMVMALTMSIDPEYKKLTWIDMNKYAKEWVKKNYMNKGIGKKDDSSREKTE